MLMTIFLQSCSANRGDSLDRNIDQENLQTKDFLILVSFWSLSKAHLIWCNQLNIWLTSMHLEFPLFSLFH